MPKRMKLEDFKSNTDIPENVYYATIKYDMLDAFKKLGRIDLDILHDCAIYNSYNILHYILTKFDVEIDRRTSGSAVNTAFKAACENGKTLIATTLLVQGADPNIVDITLSREFIHSEEDLRRTALFLLANNISFKFEKTIGECAG